MPGYRLPSSDGLRPVGDDVLAGFGRLVTARHLRRAGDGWQRRGSGCVYGPCGGHDRLADRTCAAFQPEVLAFVRVEVLLPEPRGGRVRSLLVDRLAVVAADDGVARHEDLPRRHVLAVRRGQVVPLEQHGGLARLDRGGGTDHRYVVALLLELVEEVDAVLDVIQRSAVGDRGHDDAVQALVRLGRVTGERDLALEGWAEQVLNRGDGDLARVVPDAHVAAVVVEPEARRLFGAVRDVAPFLHLVWRELGGVGQRHGLADVDHIRRAAGAVERVDLVLAAAVRVERGDVDSVLGLEASDDGAVVRPVGRQRDDRQLALGLGGRDKRIHSATAGGRRLLRPVGRSRGR